MVTVDSRPSSVKIDTGPGPTVVSGQSALKSQTSTATVRGDRADLEC